MYSTTEDLQSQINKAKSIKQLQKLQAETIAKDAAPTALEYLLSTAAIHGFDRKSFTKQLIQQSSLERSYIYHLLSGEVGMTRDKLIQFAIIGKFTLEETNTLLKYGQEAKLYARDTRDAVIIYSFNQRFSLIETNQALDDLDHNILK